MKKFQKLMIYIAKRLFFLIDLTLRLALAIILSILIELLALFTCFFVRTRYMYYFDDLTSNVWHKLFKHLHKK